jgi:hypothetical protein
MANIASRGMGEKVALQRDGLFGAGSPARGHGLDNTRQGSRETGDPAADRPGLVKCNGFTTGHTRIWRPCVAALKLVPTL